jgi:hypothetical protein
MIEAPTLLRLAWASAMAIAVLLALLFVLALLINSGFDDVILHLLGGFLFFLRENLARISTDSATWAPGLVAFCLALAIAHRFLHSYAVRTNRSWSFITTICLGSALPVLFVVAFIVPGVMLQVKSLAQVPWFERSSSLPAMVRLSLRNIAQACHYLAATHPDGRFPDSLEAIDEELIPADNRFMPSPGTDVPQEPPVYLGSGFTLDSPPGQALLISPPFRKRQTDIRIVITRGGVTLEIPAAEAEAWIDRVLDEKKPAGSK